MKKFAAVVALVVALLMLSAVALFRQGASAGAETSPTASTAPQSSSAPVAKPVAVPAPTTVEGYRKMWASVDPAYWGAADVSLSVPMADGRVVWLYGDTLSTKNGMVNSTALVQTGGRLHVSQRGMQLLPAGGTNAKGQRVVYWIEEARALNGTDLEVTAAPIWIGKANTLNFGRENSRSRTAVVRLDAAGDVRFVRWSGWVAAPKMDTHFLTPAEGAPYQKEGHLFYGKREHRWAKLANGKTLVTVCQNRVVPDMVGGKINYDSYRVVFIEK